MHIHIRQELATVQHHGWFSCAHCKHWQQAEVRATGAGNVTLRGGQQAARARAQHNAERNGERLLRFAKCPKCRARRSAAAFAGIYLLVFAICTALAFVLGSMAPAFDHSLDAHTAHIFCTWVPLAISIFFGFLLFAVAVAEWRGIDRRVRWLERQ